MKRILTVVLLLVLAAGAASAWRYWPQIEPLAQPYIAMLTKPSGEKPGAAPKQAPPVTVVVAQVAKKAMPVKMTTIAAVQPIATVSVKSRIDGQIMQVHVNEGQEVKAGDLLFSLDARAMDAQIRQAEALVSRDRAQLAQSKRDVDRLSELASKEYASRTNVDTRRTDSLALEASVRAGEASVDNMRVQLTYYTIRSPIDGRVGAIALKTGNLVKANDTIVMVTINQMRPIYVSFAAPQRDLPEIRKAMLAGSVPVSAASPGDSGPEAEGRLSFIDNAVDAATGTINLKATFANDENRLWPGQFVNASVTLRVENDATVVPASAVQIGQDGNYVFTIGQDNTATLKPVTVARVVGNETVIAKGLEPGETVVIEGAYRLTKGSKVIPQKPKSGRGTTS